jgi:hypothetical protein
LCSLLFHLPLHETDHHEIDWNADSKDFKDDEILRIVKEFLKSKNLTNHMTMHYLKSMVYFLKVIYQYN